MKKILLLILILGVAGIGGYFIWQANSVSPTDLRTYTPAIDCTAIYKDGAPPTPMQFVEQRKNYMIFNDAGNSIQGRPGVGLGPKYRYCNEFTAIEQGFLGAHPDDTQILFAFKDWENRGGSALPIVREKAKGIGTERPPYGQGQPGNSLETNPNSRIEQLPGVGGWHQYVFPETGALDNFLISLIFGVEFSHRWLTYPYFKTAGDDRVEKYGDIRVTNGSTLLLGNELGHWNFYADTDNGVVLGSDWTDNNDGTFTNNPRPFSQPLKFSNLEMYLLGFMPKDKVAPFFVIKNPYNCRAFINDDGVSQPVDCPDRFVQGTGQYRKFTVYGERVDVTIDDIIAYEGPRIPDYKSAQRNFNVSYILIKAPEKMLSEADKQKVEQIVDRAIELWGDMTRGESVLVNKTMR